MDRLTLERLEAVEARSVETAENLARLVLQFDRSLDASIRLADQVNSQRDRLIAVETQAEESTRMLTNTCDLDDDDQVTAEIDENMVSVSRVLEQLDVVLPPPAPAVPEPHPIPLRRVRMRPPTDMPTPEPVVEPTPPPAEPRRRLPQPAGMVLFHSPHIDGEGCATPKPRAVTEYLNYFEGKEATTMMVIWTLERLLEGYPNVAVQDGGDHIQMRWDGVRGTLVYRAIRYDHIDWRHQVDQNDLTD